MIDRTLHSYLSNFVSLSNMQDSLQKHIEKLKIMKESAKRRNELYSDLTKLKSEKDGVDTKTRNTRDQILDLSFPQKQVEQFPKN